MSTGKRITIKDVAEAAGVSRSTTSRAITGAGYVAPDVRRRVQLAARRLGYVPDAVARSLKQQRSSVIGVLVSDLSNSFYAEVAAGASSRIRRAGLGVMLADTAGEVRGEASAAEMFVSLRVAGVLVTPISHAVTDYLLNAQVPTVEVDRYFASGKADSVGVSNAEGAQEMTQRLIELGHREIVLLIDETNWTTGRDRLEGFKQALRQHGIEFRDENVAAAGWDSEAARTSAAQVLARPHPPTALFAANNVLAEGAWRAIQDAGLRLPADISLAAFDEAPWMTMVDPQVSTVGQNAHELGEAAADLLLDRMGQEGRSARSLELATHIADRGSIGPPAAH